MNGDPLAHWPDRSTLEDSDGNVVLVYSLADSLRQGRRWADGAWRPATVTPERAATVSARALAGWALSSEDNELANAFLALGASRLRHAHSMSLDLRDRPPHAPVPGHVSVSPLDAQRLTEMAMDVARVAHAAHAVDGEGWGSLDEATDAMRSTATGHVLGPLLDCSVIATRQSTVVGACLVVDRPGDPPAGGPWVLDVFRDPADPARGIGAAMLSQTAQSALASNLPALSLAVSDENTAARRVYERLGFVDVGESWTLALPA